MKDWRPKGGRKRSTLKQKFHGWLHEALFKQTSQIAEEQRIQISVVPPRGTSSWAYDGSGLVKRYKENYGRCDFMSGKQYDCDLSASYNIAARFFARRTLLTQLVADKKKHEQFPSPAARNCSGPKRGRRSGGKKPSTVGPRTPVTLSSLWLHRQQGAAA
jgi:hypothetical protein